MKGKNGSRTDEKQKKLLYIALSLHVRKVCCTCVRVDVCVCVYLHVHVHCVLYMCTC